MGIKTARAEDYLQRKKQNAECSNIRKQFKYMTQMEKEKELHLIKIEKLNKKAIDNNQTLEKKEVQLLNKINKKKYKEEEKFNAVMERRKSTSQMIEYNII